MGFVKKDFFCVGCCAFVMPLVLFFSAYGASSVRSLGGAVSSSVAKNGSNGVTATPRATSLPVTAMKSTSITTNSANPVKSAGGQSSDSQRMPFGVHVSSTVAPTPTPGDIESAQQRADLIERTGELEERANGADDEILSLHEKDDSIDKSIDEINIALDGKQKTLVPGDYISITDTGDTATISATYKTGTAEESGLTRLYGATGDAVNGTMTQVAVTSELNTLQNSISGVNNRAGALETRATNLETGLNNTTTEITNLKKIDAGHDEDIKAIRAALTGKEKTLEAGDHISITDNKTTTRISATYSAGSNISIAADGKISVSDVLPAQRLTGVNGSNGQLLQTNGNGDMTWVDAPSTSKVRNASGTVLYDMWVDTGN